MILPTKRLSPERALLTVGADIIKLLDGPKTVSRLWEELRHGDDHGRHVRSITFDWFVLALDLLYILRAVDLERGRIRRVKP